MQAYTGILWCVAWIVGLLTTQVSWLTAVCAVAFVVTGITLRKLQPAKFQIEPWLIAALITGVAVGWYHFRTPQPQASDISRYISAIDRQVVQVTGEVPGLAPEPWQVSHLSHDGTRMVVSKPWAACSSVISRL